MACGSGDRIFGFQCPKCQKIAVRVETASRFKCRGCGATLEPTGDAGRAEMNVSPGDEVIIPQRPSSDFLIDGERYAIVHEEQDILCVIEKEAA